THGRVYVTGCGANLRGVAFGTLPDNVSVVRGTPEGAPGLGGRGAGAVGGGRGPRADRLRAGRLAARPGPCVRAGPGRLQLLLHLLRDSARAGGVEEQGCGRGARRGRETRATGPPRGRPHGHQPRVLPGSRGWLRAGTAGSRGRRRGWSRAPPPLVDRDQPRERRARRCPAWDPGRVAAPPRSAPVRR